MGREIDSGAVGVAVATCLVRGRGPEAPLVDTLHPEHGATVARARLEHAVLLAHDQTLAGELLEAARAYEPGIARWVRAMLAVRVRGGV